MRNKTYRGEWGIMGCEAKRESIFLLNMMCRHHFKYALCIPFT